MPIRIARIATTITSHLLQPERVVISHAGAHSESVYLNVAVVNTTGETGYGEAATVLLWSGESAASAKWLVDTVIAPALVGATFDHPAEALALMDRLAVHNSFAKSAIDTALWDLWAKQQGVSVYQCFANRQPLQRIPVRGSIGAYPLDRTIELAKGFWQEGVRTLKFKVGLPGGEDIRRLLAVRDALGDEPVFTVDYNGAFQSADDAVAHIDSLRPARVAIYEQPTHRDRIALMAEVRKRAGVPILADESIFTRAHLAEAIELDAFDILSIYPGKNGGFTHAIEMAHMAARAGKPCVIGSNLETDIGQAAMGALAAGLSAFAEGSACDLLSRMYYQRSSVVNGTPLVDGAYVPAHGIGFGVTPVAEIADKL